VAKKFADTLPPMGRVTVGGEKTGVILVVRPAESVPWLVIAAENVTGPAKFPTLMMLTVETTELPLGTPTEPGTANRVKSWNCTVKLIVVD